MDVAHLDLSHPYSCSQRDRGVALLGSFLLDNAFTTSPIRVLHSYPITDDLLLHCLMLTMCVVGFNSEPTTIRYVQHIQYICGPTDAYGDWLQYLAPTTV